LLVLALVPLLLACQPSGENTYRGYLYFAQGSYLMRISLREASFEVATHLGDKQIREISDFGEGRLLIAETASINRKNVARISWVDLKTGQLQAMYPGVKARFIAVADAIVYDDGSRLYSVTQQDGAELSSQVLSHKRFQLSDMVEVSNGRLLIEMLEDGIPGIVVYHAEAGTLTRLQPLAQLCGLKGAVWIDDLEQLACRERAQAEEGANHDYVFANLEGEVLSRPALPDGGNFLALSYISNQGALVFKESWISEFDGQRKSAVWMHDPRSGENQLITDTVNLGSSVVYADY
jgi:hypothetical protein